MGRVTSPEAEIANARPVPYERLLAACYEDMRRMARAMSAPTGPGAGAVPEPGAWSLMIAGFGLLGTALRRRRAHPSLV